MGFDGRQCSFAWRRVASDYCLYSGNRRKGEKMDIPNKDTKHIGMTKIIHQA
jgi:hypothetical protein